MGRQKVRRQRVRRHRGCAISVAVALLQVVLAMVVRTVKAQAAEE